MIRLLACVAVYLGLFTVLQGDDTASTTSSLQDLHERRCKLLAEDLAAIQEAHPYGLASNSDVREAKIRLLLAEAEAAIDDAIRERKRRAAIELLQKIVDRTEALVHTGGATPASYRDAQIRLIETQLSFHTGG